MCGRYSLSPTERELVDRFQIEEFHDTRIVPRFNIAPSQDVSVIISIDNQKVLTSCRWGLIPSWVKDLSRMKPIINARAETIAEKPSFKKALISQRCIIPADGFYEWKTVAGGKTPMRICLKDKQLFGFAGLWETWTSPDGEVIRTCTIITVAANSAVADIHERMPVVLNSEMESTWLNSTLKDPKVIQEMLLPYRDSEQIMTYPVSKLVNSASVDTPQCSEAV